MATAYLPLLSCTVGARDALIVACILPFNHTHSVLSTSRTIESCDQNLSIASEIKFSHTARGYSASINRAAIVAEQET
jgi:hypothetical protein